MKKLKYIKRYDVEADHVPGRTKADLGQWIGVEIECFIPKASFKLGKAKDDDDDYGDGEDSRCYNKLAEMIRQRRIPNVTVKGDGSISAPDSSFYECEITITFKRTNRRPLRALCDMLRVLRTQVNNTCGLHIHLDCRDIENNSQRRWNDPIPEGVWQRGRNLEKMLPLMLKMVSRSRRRNSYCNPQMSTGRTAINLGAFQAHGTIEVRLHQGTSNYVKISNWIDLLYRASRSKKIDFRRVETVEDLKLYLDRAPKKLLEYANKRIVELSESEAA